MSFKNWPYWLKGGIFVLVLVCILTIINWIIFLHNLDSILQAPFAFGIFPGVLLNIEYLRAYGLINNIINLIILQEKYQKQKVLEV